MCTYYAQKWYMHSVYRNTTLNRISICSFAMEVTFTPGTQQISCIWPILYENTNNNNMLHDHIYIYMMCMAVYKITNRPFLSLPPSSYLPPHTNNTPRCLKWHEWVCLYNVNLAVGSVRMSDGLNFAQANSVEDFSTKRSNKYYIPL